MTQSGYPASGEINASTFTTFELFLGIKQCYDPESLRAYLHCIAYCVSSV